MHDPDGAPESTSYPGTQATTRRSASPRRTSSRPTASGTATPPGPAGTMRQEHNRPLCASASSMPRSSRETLPTGGPSTTSRSRTARSQPGASNPRSYGFVPSGLSFLASKHGNGLLVWAFTASQTGPWGPFNSSSLSRAFGARGRRLAKEGTRRAGLRIRSSSREHRPSPDRRKPRSTTEALRDGSRTRRSTARRVDPATSIRFIRVDVSKILQGTVPTDKASGFVDRIFDSVIRTTLPTRSATTDAPAVEVTNGDAVLAYIRSGTSVYPEVQVQPLLRSRERHPAEPAHPQERLPAGQ